MILDCIKSAYKELIKEGLTPLELNFHSFTITPERFNAIGLAVMEEKVRLGMQATYNLDNYQKKLGLKTSLDYDNILEVERKIKSGVATQQEKQDIVPMLELVLPAKIKADKNISTMEMDHAITNEGVAKIMSTMLYTEFLYNKTINHSNNIKAETKEYYVNDILASEVEQNQFVATLILLKEKLPKAYKVIKHNMGLLNQRATATNQLDGFDLKNPEKLILAQKIIAENKEIAKNIQFINLQEAQPSEAIIREVAKYDTKFAMEKYPKEMKNIISAQKNKDKNKYF
jgi:hypothetical protein